jgi:molecular chaperone DnaJ
VLGVDADASPAEIRAAYRALARRLHPDRAVDASAESMGAGSMSAVNEAYRVLSDPGRRLDYDRSLRDAATGRPRVAERHTDRVHDDHDASVSTPHTSPLSPAGPARVPWRLMGGAALLGSAIVVVSSVFADPPADEVPDGIIEPGSCVAFETNGDAREVACGGGAVVVEAMVPLDGVCPAGTVAHRDRLGLGIACVGA